MDPMGLCSSNRSQPSATVRTVWLPMVSFAKGVTFGGFKRRVASFRVAGVALRDIQTHCIFRGGRNTFETIIVILRGRRSTLGVSIFILRGRRSTLDVPCGSFFANRIFRAAWSGDKVQIPWQAWHFVRCVENWREASHETSILRLQIFWFKENL